MNKKQLFLILLVLLPFKSVLAEIGLQFSLDHHYWKSGIESPQSAPSFGIGLGYFGERMYFTGAYTLNNHTRTSDDENVEDNFEFPLVESDIAVGYHLLTNFSAFVGYRYQNINYKNPEDSDLSFYESGHGIGVGVKINQLLGTRWISYQSLSLSTLWMDNNHMQYSDDGYRDYSFNVLLGILYRLSEKNSLSLDITYKGSSLDHGIDVIEETRSYWKTGLNLITVF